MRTISRILGLLQFTIIWKKTQINRPKSLNGSLQISPVCCRHSPNTKLPQSGWIDLAIYSEVEQKRRANQRTVFLNERGESVRGAQGRFLSEVVMGQKKYRKNCAWMTPHLKCRERHNDYSSSQCLVYETSHCKITAAAAWKGMARGWRTDALWMGIIAMGAHSEMREREDELRLLRHKILSSWEKNLWALCPRLDAGLICW